MQKLQWSQLNHLQLGKLGEYLVKLEFVSYGLDIYTSEVDDKGIDFIIRKNSKKYYDIQVKSIRNLNYIFFPKKSFVLRDNLLAAIVVFIEKNDPYIFLIPSKEWTDPNSLLVSHDYVGKQSKPEWGINISQKNWDLLMEYQFHKVISIL